MANEGTFVVNVQIPTTVRNLVEWTFSTKFSFTWEHRYNEFKKDDQVRLTFSRGGLILTVHINGGDWVSMTANIERMTMRCNKPIATAHFGDVYDALHTRLVEPVGLYTKENIIVE